MIGPIHAFVATLVLAAATASAAPPSLKLDISAQPLSDALNEFARQSGLQVVIDWKDSTGITAPPVHGTMTREEGLRKLLEKSGLEYEFINERTVAVREKESEGKKTGSVQERSDVIRVAQVSVDPAEGPKPQQDSAAELEEIVVTGSHIRGATPASPVITIDKLEIERSGYQSTGDLVRNLPQSYAGGMNPTVVQAGGGSQNQNQYSGASSVNLRGFGSESTLTLVNGRRLASSDNLSAVDVSVIPLAAIDHVDVLADGASAIYGSDAVAGVVNFILKRNFSGLETRASYGEATSGGGASQLYSVVGGQNWTGGNATLSYEHAQQQPVFGRERSFVSSDIPAMSLIPKTSRDSLFAFVEHGVGSSVELFAQGLYTQRSSHQYVDFRAQQGAFSETDADVTQYGVTAGANLRVSDAWQVSLAGNYSRTSADDPQRVSFTATPEFNFALAQKFVNELTQFDAKADGALATLPAGPVTLAVGASYREETFLEVQEFEGAPPPITDINARRHVTSAYSEINIPIVPARNEGSSLPGLFLVAAGRYEKYSDSGSSTVPKLGLVYSPRSDLQLKASWGKSFRAPTLSQEYTAPVASLAYDSDPFDPSGNSFKIYLGGGNPNLEPETSTATTVSALLTPAWLEDAHLALTYFHIDYTDRIVIPLQGFTAYADPANLPFVTRDPTPQQIASALEGASFFNNTGFPYDPSLVAAIADGRFLNASRQVAEGFDVVTSYQRRAGIGQLGFTLNATYLELSQAISSASPEQTLSGKVFNPARFRARAGANWQVGGLSVSAYLNFVSALTNTVVTPQESISSWTTADVNLAYVFREVSWAKRTQVALSVQNLFDRDPPFINALSTSPPGVQYDSTNASAVGRFIGLTATVGW